MNIILEGPDCAGKTTLANNLFRGCHYYHNGPWDDPFWQYVYQITKHDGPLLNPRSSCVWDRYWMSNLIYGPLLGTKVISYTEQVLLERLTLAVGAIMVICLPPKDECMARWKGRRAKELVQDEELVSTIWDRYSTIATFGLPTITINPFRMDEELLFNDLLQLRGRHVSE